MEPLGFRPSDRSLRRAGLDYWLGVDVQLVQDLGSYLTQCARPFYLFSSKVTRRYTEVSYPPDVLLVFGSETTGLPPDFLKLYPDQCVTLPMRPGARCLNLSNSVAIAVYEAWRQNGFQ